MLATGRHAVCRHATSRQASHHITFPRPTAGRRKGAKLAPAAGAIKHLALLNARVKTNTPNTPRFTSRSAALCFDGDFLSLAKGRWHGTLRGSDRSGA